MNQLRFLVTTAVMIGLSAAGALAAGPDDPFEKADALVSMCSGIFPVVAVLIIIGFMIVVLVKNQQDKRNK